MVLHKDPPDGRPKRRSSIVPASLFFGARKYAYQPLCSCTVVLQQVTEKAHHTLGGACRYSIDRLRTRRCIRMRRRQICQRGRNRKFTGGITESQANCRNYLRKILPWLPLHGRRVRPREHVATLFRLIERDDRRHRSERKACFSLCIVPTGAIGPLSWSQKNSPAEMVQRRILQ